MYQVITQWDQLRDLELGAFVEHGKTIFRLYAETCEKVAIRLYETPDSTICVTVPMAEMPLLLDLPEAKKKHPYRKGRFYEAVLDRDCSGLYYEIELQRKGGTVVCQDPWAKSMTTDSSRAMIVHFAHMRPSGWENHKRPGPIPRTASLLYETHVRDHTMTLPIEDKLKGKYVGFAARGTTTAQGNTTGLDHLVELGVTHVHLLPLHDMGSMDETFPGYNWGYDPAFYMAPEGGYATDAFDGRTRVIEMRQMVQGIHEAGLRVVLDVVYNHVWEASGHPFEALAPGQFFRKDSKGQFGNGSGCGNETRSESWLFRKYLYDALKLYIEAYKIDGFRFDLMALHDQACMTLMSEEIQRLQPGTLVYGEPWTGGTSLLPLKHQFRQGRQQGLQMSLFNDHLRNALKGDNDGVEKGFVSGGDQVEREVAKGIIGGTTYVSKIGHKPVKLSDYAALAGEVVQYVSCHDNLCLLDKMKKTHAEEDLATLSGRMLMAVGVIMMSFGIPFLQAGTEVLRTKQGDHNSFISGDRVNAIQWSDKDRYYSFYEAVRQLISLRKTLGVFVEESPEWIEKHLVFHKLGHGVIDYSIQRGNDRIRIVFNSSDKVYAVNQPMKVLFHSEKWLRIKGSPQEMKSKTHELMKRHGEHAQSSRVAGGQFIIGIQAGGSGPVQG